MLKKITVVVGMALCALLASLTGFAGGEAGPIHLRDQGHFYVGVRTRDVPGNSAAGPIFGAAGVSVYGQMYVGYQLPENKTQQYPVILIHGGGGQATDYQSTPDGRDGWVDYFINAGFDVYFIDRPGHGRSPNSTEYGELAAPASSGIISMLATSDQWPGDGSMTDPSILQHLATSEPGPTVDNDMLKENLGELLDRVGPAIVLAHSAGGPAGYLTVEARPELVKGLIAIETAGGIQPLPMLTWQPALAFGEELALEQLPPIAEGKASCMAQPENSVRKLVNFEGLPILSILAPQSLMFLPDFHCSVDLINQAGGNARLVKLEDVGIEGNGHFMMEGKNNGEIAQFIINWMSQVK